MNLPIAVDDASFLAEVPVGLEAAAVDGCGLIHTRSIVAPVAARHRRDGAICFIFSWNELPLRPGAYATVAQTAPVFLTSFVTSQGCSWQCARRRSSCLPVLAAGFAAQDKLVRVHKGRQVTLP
jgi:sorbitol/mannitol transport system permease protein